MNNEPDFEESVEGPLNDWRQQARPDMNLCRNPHLQEAPVPQRHDILESICDEFYALDRTWRFTYLNNRCTCNYESRYEELLGKVVWDEFPMVRGGIFEAQCRRAMREQAAGHFEVLSVSSQRWVEVHTYPTPERLWVYSHDVTPRKAAEAQRERLLQEAQQASRLKDDFLATVAHELRSPLNAVIGWASLLRGGELDEADQIRGMETIERSARAQAQIIEDILDISRVITGKMRLETRRVDLADVLRGAIDIARPTADAKGVQLCLELHAGGDVTGDPDRLQQVFSNLLSNAVKFTPRGGRVSVALHNLGKDVHVTVTDTGQGISPQFLPLIFEQFQQADATSSRAHGGLGLGLSIVRQLVELHGGKVWAEGGSPGSGAIFTVSLPYARVTPERDESVPSDSSRLATLSNSEGSRTDELSSESQSNTPRSHRQSSSTSSRPSHSIHQGMGVQWSHSLTGTALHPVS